jgi:hypothetical protein
MPAGGTIWITDAHGDNGNRLVVRADEKLTALLEFECAIRASDESPRQAGTIRLNRRPKKSDYTIVAELRWQSLALAFTGAMRNGKTPDHSERTIGNTSLAMNVQDPI